MPSAPSIGFEFRPSRWPCLLLLAMGVLAIVAVFASGVSVVPASALSVLLVVYLVWACRCTTMCRVQRLTWRADGGWSLRLHDDEDVEARLLGAQVLAAMIILRLAWEPRGGETLILLPDNLDSDTRRRLRMRVSAIPDKH